MAAIEVASWRAAYRDLMPKAYLDALSFEDKTANWARSLSGEDARRKRTLVAVNHADSRSASRQQAPTLMEPSACCS
ncbi:MAG: hypothetical protein M3P30_06755 [Chloroflexota bacterium]|nr:hypothetical protein [Chloroflexota bacterium]